MLAITETTVKYNTNLCQLSRDSYLEELVTDMRRVGVMKVNSNLKLISDYTNDIVRPISKLNLNVISDHIKGVKGDITTLKLTVTTTAPASCT